MAKRRTRINTFDFSKKPHGYAQHDFRTGEDDIGAILNFEPYEGGYCFLTTIATPRFMWQSSNKAVVDKAQDFAQFDNRHKLLKGFVDIVDREFKGLTGIEGGNLTTNDISNNIMNIPVISKNERNIYNTVTMSFTEKSGLILTKFLDMYTRYLYDPYTNVKSYGGRRYKLYGKREDGKDDWLTETILPKKRNNETFSFLYVITDRTCLLVEKAFILYQAYPTNDPIEIIADNTKFEVETKEIAINFICEVLDGPLANRLGQIYVSDLYDRVIKPHILRGEVIDDAKELDYHISVATDTVDDTMLSLSDFNYKAINNTKSSAYDHAEKTDSMYIKKYVKIAKENGTLTDYHSK